MSRPVCEECPLRALWGKPYKHGIEYRQVKYRCGTGDVNEIELAIVGESPGVEEMASNKAFVGASGELLEDLLTQTGIDTTKVLYANACRCLLTKDELSTKEINKVLECCRPKLAHVLKVAKPNVILAVGEIASQQLLKNITKIKKISSIRGKVFYSDEFDCYIVPTFHPAFCLRSKNHIYYLRADIQKVATLVKNPLSDTLKADQDIEYEAVDSIDFILNKAYDPPLYLGIDTETQGLDFVDKNSVVISYSIATEDNKAYHIWLLKEVDPKTDSYDFTIDWPYDDKKTKRTIYVKKCFNYQKKIQELAELLRRKDIKKIMMNGNYDLLRFHQLGLTDINSYVIDVQLAMQVLNPDAFKKESLETIQSVLFPEQIGHKDLVLEHKSDMLSLSKENPQLLVEYACRDAAVTRACGMKLRKWLAQDKDLLFYYSKLAHPVTSVVLFNIEKHGIKIDVNRIVTAQKEISKQLIEVEKNVLALIPDEIKDKHENLKLSRDLLVLDILYDEKGLGLTPLETTKGGRPSAKKDVLKAYLRQLDPQSDAYKIINGILTFRRLAKLKSSFLDGFYKFIRADGRIHPSIAKAAATGRTTCSNPNLQTIPKHDENMRKIMRPMFVAPEGKVLVSIDYSQAELRWIAFESRDEEMINVYKSGQDIHLRTALGFIGKSSPDDLDPAELKKLRNRAKPVNFGIVYMMSPEGLKDYAINNYGVLDMTTSDAEKYIDMYFKLYPKVKEWQHRKIEFAKRYGYCKTAFGLKRFVPEINSKDSYLRQRAERIAVNTPIQGSSNDMTLFAALEGHRTGIIDNNRAKLVLFIHDELIFEVDENYAVEFTEKMLDLMQNIHIPMKRDFGFDFDIPLEADASIGKDLYHMEDFHA